MSAIEETTIDVFGATLSRGKFVKGGGALVASLSIVGAGLGARAASAASPDGGTGQLDSTLPSSWLDINADNTIVLRTGKIELGQGSASTAFAMITAEELNVPYSAITQVVMGDTDRTPDGGFSAGYMGGGSPNVRVVAAYVYQALLSLASSQFGVPTSSLSVTNGVVSGGGKTMSYGQLVSGQALNLKIPVAGVLPNGAFGVTVLGTPPTKPIADYQIIGQSIPMRTIPPIVTGEATYVGDVTLPGMLHARVVHPPDLGSTLVSPGTLDKSAFPNTQIVTKGNLLAVVDPLEYVAVEAASILAGKAQWTTWSGLPGSDNLYGAMRSLPWQGPALGANTGNAFATLTGAAKTMSATYEFPFAKHAPIGPTAAVADVRSDGTIWVYSHSANPQAQRTVIATMMNTSPANVIIRNFDGSGHYGRSNGGSTGAEDEAVIISSIVGKPIRLQWMRWDDMRWSTQHSPQLSDVHAALDANNNLIAYQVNHFGPGGQDDRPIGALLAGLPTMAAPGSKTPPPSNFIQLTSWGMSDTWVYDKLPNALEQAYGSFQMGTNPALPQNFDTQVGMRSHSMRTPGQRQQNYVRESFLNEVAAQAGIDPFQLRLKNASATRLANVVNSVIQASGWQTRPSPSKDASTTASTPIQGQGCSVMLRSNAYWTCVAQLTVTPKTGKISVNKLTVAVDPGVVINPRQLTRMAQGGAIMGTSEALHEEVHFNTGGITDHDWVSFPILRMIEAPEVDVVIINNPGVGAYGSGGEGPNGFVQAAIASAVFDATGKMPRRIPFTPGYIRALLAS